MQRFWWPGYEMQLLEQLQRQQKSAQFCDTLLQTEGISVPTHSCVLAALSPYLSQSLSATPSPPLGQMRRLHLQAVTAQTLLKLVGLMYSGELEVKSCEEQNDMLAAAHRFGISDLALGCGDEGRKGEELLESVRTEEGTELHKSVKMQDAQVQAEMSRRTDDDPHVKDKSFVSVGTQTVNSSLMSAASPGHLCDQATPPALQCVSSAATVSISLQPENITQFSFASYPIIHSDPESTAGQSSDCLTYPSFPSASSRYIETLPTSLKADARSPRSHKKNNCKQSPKSGESVSDQHRSGQEDGNANADGGTSTQLRGVCRERILEGEKEKRNSHFIGRGKNFEKMKQTEPVMKTAQIPFKVKLKRRAKGELWKIVGLQDADETVSVLTTIKRSCCSPQPLHHASLSSDSEARSNSCFSMNQSRVTEMESESPSPPPGPVEESDEQIDKLLEDIMMSLNILPNLDKNCKKTQANHDGVPTFCQGPAAEDGAGVTPLHADVSVAGFYQDLETHGGHSTTDTGIHCCSGAQNQASYTDPPTGQNDLQTQLSESSSSIRSCGPINGLSCPGEENSSYPQTTGSILPVTCCSSGEKLQYFVLQQQDQNIEFLSLSHESETQPADAFSLHRGDNLRLPQCLSPLEPCPSAAHQQPDPSVSVQPENSIQPSGKTRPWLTEAACRLRFPFNGITAGKNASRPPETSSGCGAELSQRRRKLKAKSDGKAGFVKNAEVRERKSKPGRKSDRIKRRNNKYEAAEDAAPPKRRRHPDSRKEPEGLPLDSISSERGDPATTVCSVSLSCNNVPIKESGKTIGSLNKPHTATGTETSKGDANLGTEQTRIRTRGFMKRSQQNTSNTISDKCCVLIPVIGRAVVVQKQDPALPKRKRGRPPKIKLEQNLPKGVRANAEIKGCKKAGEKVSEKETPKEEQKKGRKLMVNASEEEAGQLQKTTSPERPGKNETNNIKSSETQKQSWKVTLKEFQKLIKCKDFKTRKATEVEDGNDSVDIEELEKVREAADEADTEAEMRQGLCDSPFNENHNLLLDTSAAQWKPTQQGVTGSSETRRSSVSGHRKKPASCPDVLEEEMVMLSSNREQGADQSSTLTGCDGEEEDEDELDVMLCSPDEGSSTRELGERVVVIPDDEEEEEEEEDVNEIDVTGDEGE